MDCLFQMLQITLDENECFSAWVSAKDGGLDSPSGSDAKRQSLLPSGALMDNIADYETWGEGGLFRATDLVHHRPLFRLFLAGA